LAALVGGSLDVRVTPASMARPQDWQNRASAAVSAAQCGQVNMCVRRIAYQPVVTAVVRRDDVVRTTVVGVQCGMVTRGIRDFMARDWAATRRLKDSYWADRIHRLGAAEGLRIAGELWQQMRLQDPSWPNTESRQADLAAHVRLAALLHRVDTTSRA
jgi:hypothetical protein